MYLITTHRAKALPDICVRAGRQVTADWPAGLWPGGLIDGGSTLGDVRLTEFWDRMNAQFGDVYAQSVARDFVFDKLGGRTIERALADGVDAKIVWRAVSDTFKVPENLR
jgi:Protein of unknown function (DUF3046)